MTVGLVVLVVAAGVLVGVLSALFGVGGGLLMVPLVVLLLADTQHVAEGTSLLVIIPTAIAGVLAHRKSGFVHLGRAAVVAAGGIAGAFVGASLALSLDAELLQTGFAVFLAAMGVRLVVQGLRSRASG